MKNQISDLIYIGEKYLDKDKLLVRHYTYQPYIPVDWIEIIFEISSENEDQGSITVYPSSITDLIDDEHIQYSTDYDIGKITIDIGALDSENVGNIYFPAEEEKCLNNPICGNKECDSLCPNCIAMSEPQMSASIPSMFRIEKACECGADSCSLPTHSSWCPKHK